MKKSNNSVWYVLDNFFKSLDIVSISSNIIFSNEEDKQIYETKFMYAYRKYQAAEYHYNNVKHHLKLEIDKANDFIENVKKFSDKPFFAEMTYVSSADHFIYELAAFLEALKSSIDFLAATSQQYLKGIQLDSVITLIRQVENGKTGYIYNIIKKNIKWLKDLRNYRHHLVHRRIITAKSLMKLKYFNNFRKLYISPILIPEFPPSYIHDTRKSRMEEDFLEDKTSFTEKIKKVNGKVIDYNFEFLISKNIIPIEKFMEKNLNLMRNFFVDFIHEISALNFKMI